MADTRFKKGCVANPTGRPKGTYVKYRMSDFVSAEEMKKIIDKAKSLALEGNEAMIKLMTEYNIAKPPQEITGAEGTPLFPTSESKEKAYDAISIYLNGRKDSISS